MNLKKLNNLLGYNKVNTLIRNMFNELDKKTVIGRWFSGDEILLISKDTKTSLTELQTASRKYNLSFKYFIFKGVKSIQHLEQKIKPISR